jgi:short subunit dehydrogenase-like uncharacterized protein
MADPKWLVYGSNGYTATLVIEEALKRGHKPVIAGRSEKKLSLLLSVQDWILQ